MGIVRCGSTGMVWWRIWPGRRSRSRISSEGGGRPMPELLTHTKRADFLRCRKFFDYRHEQHLDLIHDRAGRRRGRAFGNALLAVRLALDEWAAGQEGEDLPTTWRDRAVADDVQASYEGWHPSSTEEATERAVEMI